MKKKICAIIFIAALALSGCGTNDALYRQAKKDIAAFSNFAKSDSKIWEVMEEKVQEDICLYETTREQIAEFLKMTDEFDPDGDFEFYFTDEGRKKSKSLKWKNLDKWTAEDGFRTEGGCIIGMLEIRSDDMEQFLQNCEQLGPV